MDFPGKRSLRGRVATQESLEIQADTELLKLDITYQVKQASYSLLLAQQILKYAEQDLELSRDYLQKAEIKHEAGDVARVEVLRARVETAKAENSVRAAANEVRLGKARPNFLLARQKDEPPRTPGGPPPGISPSPFPSPSFSGSRRRERLPRPRRTSRRYARGENTSPTLSPWTGKNPPPGR